MSAPVELIPLKCAHCGTPVPAKPDEIAWACQECGRGLHLHKHEGLMPIEINYQRSRSEKIGRPFWVAEGRVQLDRDTYGWGDKDNDALNFWAQPRQFFIPAYEIGVDPLIDIGRNYLHHPPQLDPAPPYAFTPPILSGEDVHPYAEFLVVSIEAERKDQIKEIKFKLNLGPRELWILR